MKRIAVAAWLGVFLLPLSVASAQSEGEAETAHFDFPSMVLDGARLSAEGSVMSVRGEARFESLLNVDRSFLEELGKSEADPSLR